LLILAAFLCLVDPGVRKALRTLAAPAYKTKPDPGSSAG
jgi:hypothetical protein